MTRDPPARRELQLFLVVATLVAAWFAHPLLSVRVLWLHDLPNHLARITALHHLPDASWNLQPYYERSLGLVPYLGHFYPVHLLAYLFGSVERANLFYLVAFVLAVPLCGLCLARATGRSPWLSLLLLPLATGYFFEWGFVSFCVAVVLFLVGLAQLYHLCDAPTPGRALLLFCVTAALYFCHVLPWATFGLLVLVAAGFELAARRVRGPLLAAAATLPTLLLFWRGLRHAAGSGYVAQAMRYKAETDTPAALLRRASSMLDLYATTTLEEWIQLLLLWVLVVLIATDAGPDAGEPLRKRARLPAALLVCLLGALATPFAMVRPINWWMINLRFLGLLAAVAIFLPRGPLRGARAWLLGAAVALSLVLPHLTRQAAADYSARVEPILRLVGKTPRGANTLVLHTPIDKGRRSFKDRALSPYMSHWREVYHWPQILRGGYDPYHYDDGFPVRRRPDRGLPAPRVESAAVRVGSPSETRFDPAAMLEAWDYFLVKDDYPDAMPPDGAALLAVDGEWSLYRSLRRP